MINYRGLYKKIVIVIFASFYALATFIFGHMIGFKEGWEQEYKSLFPDYKLVPLCEFYWRQKDEDGMGGSCGCDACEGKQFWSKEPEYGGPNVP